MAFYKDKYDVIVIGGALAGMSCAMKLASEGKDVLILERHNLPGGIATSFSRSGIEMEATLHEMMSIGPEDDPLFPELDGVQDRRVTQVPWDNAYDAEGIAIMVKQCEESRDMLDGLDQTVSKFLLVAVA